MSSNKKLYLSSDTQNKSSFDKRICDDLSEVILQFLPFDDKIRLECVSKQFQKTIFKKVYRIDVDNMSSTYKLDALQSVLKKCPQINSFVCNEFNFLNRKFIDLIKKYCNNLVEIDCNEQQICEQLVKKFNKKSFTLIQSEEFEQTFVNSLSHIKELVIKSMDYEILDFVALNNLKSISLELYFGDYIYLDTFVKNNKNLKSLELNCIYSDDCETNCEHYLKDINILLNQISKLKHLTHLKIRTKIGLNITDFNEGVNKIGVNCQQLKSFEFRFILYSLYDCHKINEFLTSFKSLKRLNIEFTKGNVNKKSVFEMFSLESFKGMEYLTHLSLKFKGKTEINSISYPNDTILLNIDKYLPKLQYLNFRHYIKASYSLPYILSRLSKLETIKLNLINSSFVGVDSSGNPVSYPFKEKIIINCKKIRVIDINVCNHIVSNDSD